jgi:TetR/AcrR family tetracycline transcriptional repressor
MAAYYHVADKDELLRLAVERVSASNPPLHRKPGEEWEKTLKDYLLSLWDTSTRYPGLGIYLINQPGLGVTPDRLEPAVRFFEEVGFPPPGARLAWSVAMTYIHGRMSVDAHLARNRGAPRLDGLRARDYVEFGVDTVVAGLRAMLESGTAPAFDDDHGARSTA